MLSGLSFGVQATHHGKRARHGAAGRRRPAPTRRHLRWRSISSNKFCMPSRGDYLPVMAGPLSRPSMNTCATEVYGSPGLLACPRAALRAVPGPGDDASFFLRVLRVSACKFDLQISRGACRAVQRQEDCRRLTKICELRIGCALPQQAQREFRRCTGRCSRIGRADLQPRARNESIAAHRQTASRRGMRAYLIILERRRRAATGQQLFQFLLLAELT
jgi:hypothetical protein